MSATDHDWAKPAAMAIPKEGYFELERGRYGPVFPRTPACYGFSIIAKVKEGCEDAIREHGKTIEAAITETPDFLAPLRLHYLRWLLFDIGDGLTSSTRASSTPTSTNTPRTPWRCSARAALRRCSLTSWDSPGTGRRNPDSFVKFVRDHHYPSFWRIGEYPYVTSDEIKKGLRIKDAFSDMLDQMQ